MTQIASAIIGGETAARAPVCCVVRTSLSFSASSIAIAAIRRGGSIAPLVHKLVPQY
jgi:hypothetical protein